jgi:hypothetical protein
MKQRLLDSIGELTMTVEITIQVPDTLGQQLQRFQDRLPEVLERGLREVMAEGADAFEDESAILALLASQPSPEQVLALHPTPELQERISELLLRSKDRTLPPQEATELERYLLLEHLVRLAKAHAAKRLAQQA